MGNILLHWHKVLRGVNDLVWLECALTIATLHMVHQHLSNVEPALPNSQCPPPPYWALHPSLQLVWHRETGQETSRFSCHPHLHVSLPHSLSAWNVQQVALLWYYCQKYVSTKVPPFSQVNFYGGILLCVQEWVLCSMAAVLSECYSLT